MLPSHTFAFMVRPAARAALPVDARCDLKSGGGAFWYFTLPETGVEPLLQGRGLVEV